MSCLNRIVFVTILAVSLNLVVIFMYATQFMGKSPKVQASNRNHIVHTTTDVKFVLYWSPFWDRKDYYLGLGFDPFQDCVYKNCYATNNRSLVALDQFDALVFHATTYRKQKHGVPWIRSPHQRYIFMNVEAPMYICSDLKQYQGFFNWTMTYRFDSDIVRRHGYAIEGETNYEVPPQELLRNKTKVAAWFVSNCVTSSRREDLTRGIQKFIPVDVYGYCGKLRCGKQKNNSKLSSRDCYNMVAQNYKFYLSFENSFCKDYSTEKLYNILSRDVVPVVYGAGDYQLSAPPHSVINVEDFDSVEELAKYLKDLSENEEEYLRYFEWKRKYKITMSPLPSACQLCAKLNEPVKQSIYYDLHEWWWGKDKYFCKSKKQLPKIVSDLL